MEFNFFPPVIKTTQALSYCLIAVFVIGLIVCGHNEGLQHHGLSENGQTTEEVVTPLYSTFVREHLHWASNFLPLSKENINKQEHVLWRPPESSGLEPSSCPSGWTQGCFSLEKEKETWKPDSRLKNLRRNQCKL